MKRLCAVLLLLMMLLLAGCGKDSVAVVEKGPYYVSVNDQRITVNPVKCTITDESGNIYTYVISDKSVTFTYPNGYEYFWNYTSGAGFGGLSDNPEGYRYLDYASLETALEQEVETGIQLQVRDPVHIFFSMLCFFIGGLNIIFPYAGWYLRYGWRFRDAEPSEAVLVMNRIAGGIAVVIGVIFLFI